jgi:hypothetical protein
VYPIFLFICYKISIVSLEGWGKTKEIFAKVQFWDTPIKNAHSGFPSYCFAEIQNELNISTFVFQKYPKK